MDAFRELEWAAFGKRRGAAERESLFAALFFVLFFFVVFLLSFLHIDMLLDDPEEEEEERCVERFFVSFRFETFLFSFPASLLLPLPCSIVKLFFLLFFCFRIDASSYVRDGGAVAMLFPDGRRRQGSPPEEEGGAGEG